MMHQSLLTTLLLQPCYYVKAQSAGAAVLVDANTRAVVEPAARPPAGWSTWTTFKCDINETLVYEAMDTLLSSGLAKKGYEYVLCVRSAPATTGNIACAVFSCYITASAQAKKLRRAGLTIVGRRQTGSEMPQQEKLWSTLNAFRMGLSH